LVYLRWEREDGHVECRLVRRKTQEVLKVKVTILRIDLEAAFNMVRLAQKVREFLKMSIGGGEYLTDSSCMTGMLQMESGRLNKFTGTKVSEIKIKSQVHKDSIGC
jgi:hypothetical protein